VEVRELTHAKSSHWHDAEAGIAVAENAIGLSTSSIIRHVRGVPDRCPTCGSQRLAPQRGYTTKFPDVEWERLVCEKCGWAGLPVPVTNIDDAPDEPPSTTAEGECVIPTLPFRKLKHPSDPT